MKSPASIPVFWPVCSACFNRPHAWSVIKVEIIHPKFDSQFPGDYSGVSFTFNGGTPGVCDIACEGTCGVPSLDPNLEWELTSRTGGDAVPGSTMTSSPDPAKGANVTFTFTGLPTQNSSFGGSKLLTLEYPSNGCAPDNQEPRLYFSREAKNHPGAGSGTDPNWYFYWSDAGADTGTHHFNPALQVNGQYSFGDDYFQVGPGGSGSYSFPVHVEGIDNFGALCLHEKAHMDYYFASWNPYVAADDDDGDLLKDTDEPNMTGMDGNPYDPLKQDSDSDGYDDGEDWAFKAQATWVIGSKDSVDWADPGHQHGF